PTSALYTLSLHDALPIFDQPQLETLLGRDLRAEQQELQRLGAADEARQPLGAAVAGNDPEIRFRLAHPRRLFQQAQMAGHGDLADRKSTRLNSSHVKISY